MASWRRAAVEFRARNRGGAALHDHDATGVVRKVRSFQIGCAGSERQSENGDDGVASAGDVHGSVRAVDREYCAASAAAFEESHAIFAARDDQGLQIQVAQGALAEIFELASVGADAGVIGGLEFRLVGSGGGDACIAKIEQAVTRIEGEELGVEFLYQRGRGGAETVIGDEQGARAFCDLTGFACDCAFCARGKFCVRFAVYAQDLLFGGVGPAGEITRFGGGDPITGAEDAGSVDAFAAKMLEELAAALIVADDADGQDARAKIGEVEDGIGRATGIGFGAAMTQDQYGRLAGHAGNFAGDEFIEDEIADDADRLAREGCNDIEKAGEVHAGVGLTDGGR